MPKGPLQSRRCRCVAAGVIVVSQWFRRGRKAQESWWPVVSVASACEDHHVDSRAEYHVPSGSVMVMVITRVSMGRSQAGDQDDGELNRAAAGGCRRMWVQGEIGEESRWGW